MNTKLYESTYSSRRLGNSRRIWYQPASGQKPAVATLMLLDGEFYIERMQSPELISELQTSLSLPAFDTVYVSHLDLEVRWEESFCNPRFARCIEEDILHWAEHEFVGFQPAGRILLGGLSLTGLAAAHTALVSPGRFAGVLCQSASFWWADNQFLTAIPEAAEESPRFRIVCGDEETTDLVDHGRGLIQRTSQLTANQMVRDRMREMGYSVSYAEYAGGHDFECWKADLPESLRTLLVG